MSVSAVSDDSSAWNGDTGTVGAPCRVFVVDQLPIFRHGLIASLADCAELDLVGDGDSVAAAVQFLSRGQEVDVVLVGLDGPPAVVIDASSQVIGLHGSGLPRVLFLGGEVAGDVLLAALAAGGSGCVSRSATPEELSRALQIVNEGACLFSAQPTEVLRLCLNRDRDEERDSSVVSTLSVREREILALVSRGLDNRRIARDLCLSEKTVRNYVSRLFAKLNVRGRAEAVALARDEGIR